MATLPTLYVRANPPLDGRKESVFINTRLQKAGWVSFWETIHKLSWVPRNSGTAIAPTFQYALGQYAPEVPKY